MKNMIVSVFLILLGVNTFAADWDLIKKRATQATAVITVANEVHKKLDPERRAAEEEKQRKIEEKRKAEYEEFQKMLGQNNDSNDEMESQVAEIFGAALSGQGSSSTTSVKSFVAVYLQELQQKYATEYKVKYKTLVSSREVQAKFEEVYPYNIKQQIMRLSSKEEAKREIDSRYPMLW